MASFSQLASLAIRIGADTSAFESGTKKASEILSRFTAKVNDVASAMDSQATQAADRFNRSIQALNGQITLFENRLKRSANAADYSATLSQLDALRDKLSQVKQAASLERLSGQLTNFGNAAQSVGRGLTTYVTAPLVGLGALSLKTAGDMESLRRGLNSTNEQVLGVGKASNFTAKELTRLEEIARLPGLGLKEAIQGATNLQAAGFSATKAERALLGFGNALAIVGKGKVELDRVTLALTQINNTPFVQGQDLNQLRQALPQIGEAMRKAFGVTSVEALKAAGITSKQFIDGILTQFEKLPRATGGLKNSFENFSDSSTIALDKVGAAINKNFDVEGKVNALGESIGKLAEGFSTMSGGAQATILTFAGFAASIGPVLLGVGAISKAIPTLIAGFNALKVAALSTGGAITAIITLSAAAIYQTKQLIDFDPQAAKVKTFTDQFVAMAQVRRDAIQAELRLEEKKRELALLNFNEALRITKARIGNNPDAPASEFKGAQDMRGLIESEQSRLDLVRAKLKAISEIPRADVLTSVAEVTKPEVLGLLEKLREELTKVTAAREASGSEKEIAMFNGRIERINTEIARLEALGKAYMLLLQGKNTLRLSSGQTTTVTEGKVNAISPFEQKPEADKINPNNYFDITGLNKAFDAVQATVRKRAKEFASTAKQAGNEMGQAISSSLGNAISGLAEIIGNAMAGAQSSSETIFASIGQIIGQFAKQVGEATIATGVAMLAIKASISNPYVAIAAGAVLVAAGAAISSAFSSLGQQGDNSGAGAGRGGVRKFAKGGIVFGPTQAVFGEYPGASTNPEVVSPLSNLREMLGDMGGGRIEIYGRLSGSDILLSNKVQTTKDYRRK